MMGAPQLCATAGSLAVFMAFGFVAMRARRLHRLRHVQRDAWPLLFVLTLTLLVFLFALLFMARFWSSPGCCEATLVSLGVTGGWLLVALPVVMKRCEL